MAPDGRWYQDETGQWWYRLANGTRTRAEERVCQNDDCGKAFLYRLSGNPGRGIYCSRSCANKATKPMRGRRGKDNPNWKGGHINKEGYRQIYVSQPDGTRKLVGEGRHVMAQVLGRDLLPEETVHHRNGDRTDNRPGNLELWSSRHPRGQRVEDLVVFAREILGVYGSDLVSS